MHIAKENLEHTSKKKNNALNTLMGTCNLFPVGSHVSFLKNKIMIKLYILLCNLPSSQFTENTFLYYQILLHPSLSFLLYGCTMVIIF